MPDRRDVHHVATKRNRLVTLFLFVFFFIEMYSLCICELKYIGLIFVICVFA